MQKGDRLRFILSKIPQLFREGRLERNKGGLSRTSVQRGLVALSDQRTLFLTSEKCSCTISLFPPFRFLPFVFLNLLALTLLDLCFIFFPPFFHSVFFRSLF